jgi:hypothetical protein
MKLVVSQHTKFQKSYNSLFYVIDLLQSHKLHCSYFDDMELGCMTCVVAQTELRTTSGSVIAYPTDVLIYSRDSHINGERYTCVINRIGNSTYYASEMSVERHSHSALTCRQRVSELCFCFSYIKCHKRTCVSQMFSE